MPQNAKTVERLGNDGFQQGPVITAGSVPDKMTQAGDGLGGLKTAAKDGLKAAAELTDVAEVAFDVIDYATLGLNVFGVGENIVRGFDAQARLGAFTKVYQETSDPVLKEVMKGAASQQKWQKKRRIGRSALGAAIVGLGVGTLLGGPIGLGVAASVLGTIKVVDTCVNLYKNNKNAELRRKEAELLLRTAFMKKDKDVFRMLDNLKIPYDEHCLDDNEMREAPEGDGFLDRLKGLFKRKKQKTPSGPESAPPTGNKKPLASEVTRINEDGTETPLYGPGEGYILGGAANQAGQEPGKQVKNISFHETAALLTPHLKRMMKETRKRFHDDAQARIDKASNLAEQAISQKKQQEAAQQDKMMEQPFVLTAE